MLTSPLQDALLFSVQTIFSVYITIVLFRFILQVARADFYNPLGRFVIKITDPLLKPMRKVIPGFYRIDWSSLILAIVLQAIELICLFLIRGFDISANPSFILGLSIWSLGEVLDMILLILLFATVIRAFMSWIQPGMYSSGSIALTQITEPLYRKARKITPDFGMLDLSPIVIIFVISLLRILFSNYLIATGKSLF